MDIELKKIKEQVLNQNLISRYLVLILGATLLAINYNLFLLPNNLVIGGTSGLSIIFNRLFNWNPSIFLIFSGIFLLILSLIFLGIQETKVTIVGAILYPAMVSFTAPLANNLIKYLDFDTTIIPVLIAGVLYGTANGLIFKVGFNTGGGDILMKIVNKYAKITEGKANFVINLIIMLSGAIIFGPNKFVYSLIVIYLNSLIIDRILIGISDSKLFIIYTKEIDKVKEYILKDLKTGVTIFEATGGYSQEKSNVLMCAVPNRDYYLFKKVVLEIDSRAFFVINDCYEVAGGVKRRNLPFI